MDIHSLSDRDLLAQLIGDKDVTRLYRGSMLPLIFGNDDTKPHPTLVAAMELAQRILLEKVRHGPTLESPQLVRDYLALHFMRHEHEAFVAIFLDAQHRLIAAKELFRGTLRELSVYPREVIKHALQRNAAAVIFAHNHPAGVAAPSRADELLTLNLKRALALVDVTVLDHFIVADTSVTSLAERGLI
jgi:DNA repair protein RadC